MTAITPKELSGLINTLEATIVDSLSWKLPINGFNICRLMKNVIYDSIYDLGVRVSGLK